jgi:hypothetical protein
MRAFKTILAYVSLTYLNLKNTHDTRYSYVVEVSTSGGVSVSNAINVTTPPTTPEGMLAPLIRLVEAQRVVRAPIRIIFSFFFQPFLSNAQIVSA